MDVDTIARWRLANHGIARPSPDLGDALGRLAASQGQDFLPATWALAQRTGPQPSYAAVAAAFDEGRVLRTHVLRPTWHLCHPADVRWLLRATGPRVHQVNAYQYRTLGVDDATNAEVRAVLERVLPGTALTRGEVARHLAEAGVRAEGPRLAHLVMYAELEGLVVSGPMKGRQHTYMLMDERAPADDRSREEALAELASRYFTSRGPATVRDLAAWASLTTTEAERARAAAAGTLERLEVAGRTYWHAAGGQPPEPGDPRVDLVQGLDELVMSYGESRDVLAEEPEPPPAPFFQAVLRDGRLVGYWRYERRGRSFVVQTRWPRPPTDVDRAGVAAFVDRFAAFVGAEVRWDGDGGDESGTDGQG